jgi:hypothetical protein
MNSIKAFKETVNCESNRAFFIRVTCGQKYLYLDMDYKRSNVNPGLLDRRPINSP